MILLRQTPQNPLSSRVLVSSFHPAHGQGQAAAEGLGWQSLALLGTMFSNSGGSRERRLAIQHNLVLVSLLLTHHLTISSDPRQLLSSRRIFRQRSAKPDLAHSYHPYRSCWANTETKAITLPFLDKACDLKGLPERKCWFSTESQAD